MADFNVAAKKEEPGRHMDLFALETQRRTFTVPELVALTKGFPNGRAKIEQPADVHGDVTANRLLLSRQFKKLSNAAHWWISGADSAKEKRRHSELFGRIERRHVGADGDLITHELREDDAVEHASDRTE